MILILLFIYFMLCSVYLGVKLINLLEMSGTLDIGSSYRFRRESLGDYREGRIEPSKFFLWQGEHMYKSTYNEKHGPVPVLPSRT